MIILRHDFAKFQKGFDLKVFVYAFPKHSLWFFNCSYFLKRNWIKRLMLIIFNNQTIFQFISSILSLGNLEI